MWVKSSQTTPQWKQTIKHCWTLGFFTSQHRQATKTHLVRSWCTWRDKNFEKQYKKHNPDSTAGRARMKLRLWNVVNHVSSCVFQGGSHPNFDFGTLKSGILSWKSWYFLWFSATQPKSLCKFSRSIEVGAEIGNRLQIFIRFWFLTLQSFAISPFVFFP